MFNSKRFILPVILLLLPSLLAAQTVIDLKEVIRIGLENNYDLKISRNEQQISDNNVTPGNAGFLPTIGLNSGYNFRSNNIDQFPADGSETVSTRSSVTQTVDAGVNLNWTIFEGFKVQTNYKRLQELKSVGELNMQLAVENFIADITAEYYNYVQQALRMQNLKQALSLSRERLRIVEARYQIGSLSRLDLQQARVDFNADSSQLIQQYEVLHSSRIRLNEMMGVDNVEQHFLAADTTISFDPTLSKSELYNNMLKVNTSLLLAEKNKVLSELDLKMAQSQNYPYLRLNGEYGFTHFDYNTGGVDKQRNWGPTVGVTLGFTIFDGFNRSREQKNARLRINNRELQLERQKLMLQSDFANMWLAYQNNIELTNLEKESLENAQINYEIAMDRYKLGDLSGILLREAQVSLLQAEQRLLTAQYRTKLYEISLLQISGRIGEYLSAQ
ncbi:TolC family protein [Petrimonas mucosa]|jgi:outer membrane protein TolC|uniref:TolC family protein n=1 Tax=Petrimonas mucosa TaxID=1642646 RepID=UPI0023F13FA5|nr:TolC family protein [Petrimonas mucosa]MDD3561448.1 TolC family protein [Petrimonas mucosa]